MEQTSVLINTKGYFTETPTEIENVVHVRQETDGWQRGSGGDRLEERSEDLRQNGIDGKARLKRRVERRGDELMRSRCA